MRKLCPSSLFIMILVGLGFMSFPGITVTGETIQGNKRSRGTELSIFEDISIVTIASKREQRITETPSTVSVITAEDIKQSGAINLAELFRSVPGIDVMAMSISDYDVCARGMNTTCVDRMLVLLDKRSVYLDFYGIVLWDMIPVVLEDIKRIEIIRGPGSVIYGANAYSGVINIITRNVEESKGTFLKAGIGEGHTETGSLIHAGKQNSLGYKLFLGWEKADEWSGEEKGLEALCGSVLVDYKISNDSQMSVSGGITDSSEGKTMSEIGLFERDGSISYMKLNYDLSALKLQCFWNEVDVDAVYLGSSYPILTNTYDLEVQHALSLGSKHLVACGATYRHNTIKSDLMDEDHSQDLWAIFLENEIRTMEKFILNLGTRYDHHSLIGEELSPRASLIYTPVEKHIFRVSCGRAFKNPSFIQSYLYVPVGFAYGNDELDPEALTTYEFEYQTCIGEKVKAKLDLFLNEYEDFIVLNNYSTTAVPYYTYRNAGEAKGIGGEIDFDVIFTETVVGTINYSYQELTNKDTDERIESAPMHKVTAAIKGNLENGCSAGVMAHYVGETYWDNQGGRVDSYTLVNAHIGRKFLHEKMEIALNIYNLFNEKHQEHPWGKEIGQRLFITVRHRF